MVEALQEMEVNRLGLGRLRIMQGAGVFKFTVDPILLAAFCRINRKERVLDLGTGGGVLPLWLAGYRDVQHVTGLELQEEIAALAVKNVTLNGLEDRIRIIHGDLRAPDPEVLQPNFKWVVSNPPYLKPAAGLIMDNPVLARSKFELTCTLEDVVKAAASLTLNNGRLALIHLPERLPEIMAIMDKHGFVPKRLALVHPKYGCPPHRVLIEGRKAAKPGLLIYKPFYLHNKEGEFTGEMMEVYRGGELPQK
ncbi:MAG TPA: methyltransferase [Firmicutes bacterium]|nr:methyltransferase [Bacillota bacterium]